MDIKELESIVEELNQSVYEKENQDNITLFSFGSTGLIEFVNYGDIMLWHSEDDDRYINDLTLEKENLINHIKRKFNEHVDELMEIYFI